MIGNTAPAPLAGTHNLLGAEVHLGPAQRHAFLEAQAACPDKFEERAIVGAHGFIECRRLAVLQLPHPLLRLRQEQLRPLRLVLELRAFVLSEREQPPQDRDGRAVDRRIRDQRQGVLLLLGQLAAPRDAMTAPPCH
ncbi:hypothetical protein [Bradyrhizobium sp. STM 3561]|uniref:hypothetical protein n=1 Tax=Bradyrhizobium sp. STM 3561 TaxID=578923 RepID=UPI00388DFA76